MIGLVGPLPLMEEWLKERGYQYIVDTDEFKEQHRNCVLNQLGTLHGQTVVSLAYLNVNFAKQSENRGNPHSLLPFKENRIYKVTYNASEDKMNAWVVSKIEDVNDSYTVIVLEICHFRRYSRNLERTGTNHVLVVVMDVMKTESVHFGELVMLESSACLNQ